MLRPGQYVNKRGEKVTLIPSLDNDNLLVSTDLTSYYTQTGTCMFWCPLNERYFIDTDPKSDLMLGNTQCNHECKHCGASGLRK